MEGMSWEKLIRTRVGPKGTKPAAAGCANNHTASANLHQLTFRSKVALRFPGGVSERRRAAVKANSEHSKARRTTWASSVGVFMERTSSPREANGAGRVRTCQRSLCINVSGSLSRRNFFFLEGFQRSRKFQSGPTFFSFE